MAFCLMLRRMSKQFSMKLEYTRNFVIIAHIDHGKSTLADRLLEVTGTVEARKMRPQYLDRMELERERGITIKMAPVRMSYALEGVPYILNLIDTPGHSDFSYEVSRALAAVEGAVLLVDITKGVQAQTISNLRAARRAGLSIIGAVNKIDLDPGSLDRVVRATAQLLGVPEHEILRVSGKTGVGVPELLRAIVERIPPPKPVDPQGSLAKALIFDSLYDDHKGIIAFMRSFSGEIRAGDEVYLVAKQARVRVKEVGYFVPEFRECPVLGAGETGYIATGLKDPDLITIGDTVARFPSAGGKLLAQGEPLAGYKEPSPVVFISFYPDGRTTYEDLRRSFSKLRLTDSAISFEPESNDALGRGLKAGFLGQLHFDIAASRLRDEFNLEFLTSFPSVAYRVIEGGESRIVKQPRDFPDKPDRTFQPVIHIEILAPNEYVANIMNLKMTYELNITEVEAMGESVLMKGTMPLAELIRDFDDQLKSISQGYASFSYELAGEEEGDVEKLEIMVANEVVPALTRVVARKDVEREARVSCEKLKDLLPKQQFAQAIQAKAQGRIIARETIAAMRKDVTGYLYGGDRSRKMKLWKKQQRGKERLKESGRVDVPLEVFREILKK